MPQSSNAPYKQYFIVELSFSLCVACAIAWLQYINVGILADSARAGKMSWSRPSWCHALKNGEPAIRCREKIHSDKAIIFLTTVGIPNMVKCGTHNIVSYTDWHSNFQLYYIHKVGLIIVLTTAEKGNEVDTIKNFDRYRPIVTTVQILMDGPYTGPTLSEKWKYYSTILNAADPILLLRQVDPVVYTVGPNTPVQCRWPDEREREREREGGRERWGEGERER